MWIEYFGTLMSVIVAVSLMQKNIRWLRIINGVGAAGFAVYGAFIDALPVLALNAFIFFVDLWYLLAMRNTDDHFDFLPVKGLQSLYVRKFIEFHLADIHTFMPEFNPEDRDGVLGCLILRDIRPVSLILYRFHGDEAEVLLDYSVPSYRDFTNARYFFDYVLRNSELAGIRKLSAVASTKIHRIYLEKIGFSEVDGSERSRYQMDLPVV